MRTDGMESQQKAGDPPATTPVQARGSPPTDVLADLDTQLMLQVRNGDSGAGDALIRRNFDRVARYIGRVIRHPRLVEDLTQDVFLQILQNARQYEPTAKFSTWLYRIATNTALNCLNRADVRRRSSEPVDGEMEFADRSVDGPDRQMNLDELKQQVARAIDALPPNQRVALTLFEYEELSYEQIAAVMNLTVDAVRSVLARARAVLRDKLANLMAS